MTHKPSAGTISEQQILSYDEIRDQIETGDFLFCSGNYPLSQLIQQATSSIWSHVGTIIRSREFDRVFVIESVEDAGVRLFPLSNYLENYQSNKPYFGKLFIAKTRRRVELANGLDWAFEKIGTRFDYEEFIKIATRIIVGGGKHGNDSKFICSELVEAIWRISGYQIAFDRRGFISPDNIWEDPIVGSYFRIQ